ncbi:unnamed protein product [Plutella xylostella]|uniref:(diamondback moth) hypothetical protein n=1 Tax=Plutella xylostella TaxID=51655 RepID=A0A8S4G960_PLUXY|nr:unnamed protein product [Plutella xylostella]
MDRITFKVNGVECSVGGEVSSDVYLVDYLRQHLGLSGTKYMCREGGCGACVVAVSARDPADMQRKTFSVNSCLTLITQCQDWEVTTVEGLGGRRGGYHPVQRALAEHNGSQCGYCSPGWVMSMYSLLESRHYDVTQCEVEESFASNICRCTGYRPILDAFKSFAKDAPKPAPTDIEDIEDLSTCRHKRDDCRQTCERAGDCPQTSEQPGDCPQTSEQPGDWCWVEETDVQDPAVMKIKLKDGKVWYRVHTVSQIFEVLNVEGYDSYMLVAGNTGRGAFHILEYPRVLVDIAAVTELRRVVLDQNLVLGGGASLTRALAALRRLAAQRPEFAYLQKLYDHILLVAHIPVRNVGSIAGNLMVKHRVPTFSSDIFLLFEAIGATLTIVDRCGQTIEVSPEHFLSLNMTGRVILNVKIPPRSERYQFFSFKTLPRAQNAHAQVNAAFLLEFHHPAGGAVASARVVLGGLSAGFVHARATEQFLVGRDAFSNETLQAALLLLEQELVVDEIPGEMSAEFRKKLALGLFYKGMLSFIPKSMLAPKYISGTIDLRKSRPLSRGKQVYDTNPLVYPLTEPSPKVEALVQCAGEARYVGDLPPQPREVFAAFVTADVGTGDIISIDPTPAMKIPGVVAFYSAKDIPGENSFMYTNLPNITAPEEILCSGIVKYYDQPIGILVADNEEVANRAALLVQVTYKTKDAPILTINDARRRDPSRVSLYSRSAAAGAGADVHVLLRGTDSIYQQYYFTMETISCVALPGDEGLEVLPSSQWLDGTQVAIARSLNIPQNTVFVTGVRVGGAYGSRITRATHVHAACALVTHLLARPCRFVMHLQPNMRVVGKRLPCTRDFEVGVNKEGAVQFLHNEVYSDNGHVFSEPLIMLVGPSLRSCYDASRWRHELYNVTTDTASNSWCRSPGSLEAIAMTEYVMERIAYALDLDPLDVRLRNLDPADAAISDIVSTLVRDGDYRRRRRNVQLYNQQNRWKKRGLRVALMSWHFGIQAAAHRLPRRRNCRRQARRDRVIQAVAYTLKLPTAKVKTRAIDVVSNPNTNITGASRTTSDVCFGAIKCCELLLARLAPVRARMAAAPWEALVQQAYSEGISLQTSYYTTAADEREFRVAGAALSEVELDVLTGEHHVTRVDLVQDAGASLNPELDIGQVEGAFVMGLGYWTSEELRYSARSGELLTDRTWYYEVPQARDIPIDFRVQLRRNSYNPLGTLGTRPVTEAPTCLAVSAALALREAVAASRRDSGLDPRQWFPVDGPYTLEANVLAAQAQLHEFLYH